MKKVSFIVMGILSVLALIGGATAWQLVPLAVYLFLEYLNVWKSTKNDVWIASLSIIMIIINSAITFSAIDIAAWTLVLVSHFRSLNQN